MLIGIPIGCYAAVRPGSLLDQALAIVSVGLVATPSYVVAILLLYFFSVRLGWFPVLGAGDAGDVLDQLHHLVLPTVALAVGWIGYIARLVRSSLLEVLGEPYIRTARAYGQPERRVVMKYALKLACIPTVAILGVGIGELMGGAVFVEIIFNRPGLGSLIFDAISNRNYPIVQGGILVVVAIFVAHQSAGRPVLRLARSAHPRESRPRARRRRRLMLDVLSRIWRSPSGRLGLVATLIVVLGGLAAPLIATHMPNQIDVAARMSPPSAEPLARHRPSRPRPASRAACSGRGSPSAWRWR